MSGRWELLDENGPPLASHSPANPFRDAAALSASAAQPSARTYFTMVKHRGKLWVFGGFGDSKGRYNDLRSYDLSTGTWELVPPTGEVPRPVYLHTAVEYEDAMWVLGGSVGKDSNDLYAFDFATKFWRRVAPSAASMSMSMGAGAGASAVPSARYGHAACVVGEHMLVTGGCKQNNVYFADAFLYHFSTNSWRKLADVPLDLAYHSMVYCEAEGEAGGGAGAGGAGAGRVLLVGGYNGARFNEHVFSLDLRPVLQGGQPGNWSVLPVSAKPSSPLSSSGSRQPAASCGSAVVLAQGSLLLFGGYTATGHAHDLFRLDLATREWCVVDTPGPRPVPRAYLQAAFHAGDGCLYIFGGYDGAKCCSDFRRIQLLQPQVDLFGLLGVLDATQIAAVAVKHFGRGGAGPAGLGMPMQDGRGALSQAQLVAVFENLKSHQRSHATATAAAAAQAAASTQAAAAASSSSSSASSYPFDTTRLADLMELGFTRAACLACLEQMYSRRQDTRNFSLVVEQLLNFVPEDTEAKNQTTGGGAATAVTTPTTNGTQQPPPQQQAPAVPPRPASASVASPTPGIGGGGGLALPPSSNASSLQDQVSRLVEENRELRLCKVCMEAQIDCVLMPCGHLVVCSDCASDLQKRGFECPAARCSISSVLKIYWS